jgi:hypothetical protein
MTDDSSHALDSTDAGDAPVSAESLDRLREAATGVILIAFERPLPRSRHVRRLMKKTRRCWLLCCAPRRQHYKQTRRVK